jgi:para-aminobenzoate synthetase/4-amino-4-deoxychorismate lyase
MPPDPTPATPPDPAPATPPDPALGVFETMLVRDGEVHLLGAHLERLERSLGALYARPLPHGLRSELLGLAAPLRGAHRLRVDVLADGTFACLTSPAADGPPRPVALRPVPAPSGGLGAHKWRDRDFLDALGSDPVPLLTGDGDGDRDGDRDAVLEAAWGNIWLLDGDSLITPPSDGRILPGVTREVLLSLAPGLGLHAAQRQVTLADAQAAPTMFVTSAIRLAVPAALHGAPAGTDPAIARIRDALASF